MRAASRTSTALHGACAPAVLYADAALDLAQFDHVIEAIDTVTAKLHLITECDRLGAPHLSMGTGNKLRRHAL